MEILNYQAIAKTGRSFREVFCDGIFWFFWRLPFNVKLASRFVRFV